MGLVIAEFMMLMLYLVELRCFNERYFDQDIYTDGV